MITTITKYQVHEIPRIKYTTNTTLTSTAIPYITTISTINNNNHHQYLYGMLILLIHNKIGTQTLNAFKYNNNNTFIFSMTREESEQCNELNYCTPECLSHARQGWQYGNTKKLTNHKKHKSITIYTQKEWGGLKTKYK